MEPFPTGKPKSPLRPLLILLFMFLGAILVGERAYRFCPYTPLSPKADAVPVSMAVAVLIGDRTSAAGIVVFHQSSPQGPVTVSGQINGLSPNAMHGFHVHEFGNLTNGCTSAGGHYNPFGQKHGDRISAVRHLGDLGNIATNGGGVASFTISDDRISLNGDNPIVGRAIVVHADCDDGGQAGNPGSEENGNSGVRVACGVIGIA